MKSAQRNGRHEDIGNTAYRIHYKNNFKTVEQIAQEAMSNIQLIQNSTSPFDFSIGEHLQYSLDSDHRSNSERTAKGNGQPSKKKKSIKVMKDKTRQQMQNTSGSHNENAEVDDPDQIFEDFFNANQQTLLDQFDREDHDDDDLNSETHQFGSQKQFAAYNDKRVEQLNSHEMKRQFVRVEQCKRPFTARNYSASKRPPTALVAGRVQSPGQIKRPPTAAARSFSPGIKVGNDGQSIGAGTIIIPAPGMEIVSKWNKFFEETDRNLQHYERVFQTSSITRKQSLGSCQARPQSSGAAAAAAGTLTIVGNGNNLINKRVSSATHVKMTEQSVQVDIKRMSSLLQSEIQQGFGELNLKQAFLCEKIMELLIQSVNTVPREEISYVFQVAKKYMFLEDEIALRRIQSFIEINGQTKRHLYREICEKLEVKLVENYGILEKERVRNKALGDEIEVLKKIMKAEIVDLKDKHERQFSEQQRHSDMQIADWQDKHDRQSAQITRLTDTLTRMRQEMVQIESQNQIASDHANQHYQTQMKQLLEKYNSVSSNLQDKDLHYTNQYDCMADLVSSHKSAIIKLQTNKETISKQSAQIEGLISEISRLNVRAATQFNDLTPRPSLQELEDLCLDFGDEKMKSRRDTTQKTKIQSMKFSDEDSVARVKRITATLVAGFAEIKEKMTRRQSEETQFGLKQTKPKMNPVGKLLFNQLNDNYISAETQQPSAQVGSKKQSIFAGRNSLTTQNTPAVESVAKKSTRKRKTFENEVRKVARKSKLISKDNLSENLSLDSGDRQILDGQSFEELGQSFDDI